MAALHLPACAGPGPAFPGPLRTALGPTGRFLPQPRVGGCSRGRGGAWAAAPPAGRRLLAAPRGGLARHPHRLEQWGPERGREGRRENRGGRCAALLRHRFLSPADRRHHAAAPLCLCLPLPRSDGNPGRDVSPAPWDRAAEEAEPRPGAAGSAGGGGVGRAARRAGGRRWRAPSRLARRT